MINRLKEVIDKCPKNVVIFDSFVKTYDTVPQYKNVMVAVSGGSDSDVVVDIMKQLFYDCKIDWVFYDTGVEYQASKDHLDYLEDKYNIEIERVRAIKPVPVSCKTYGQPFISKYVSEMISRLQKHNFKFEDETYEKLVVEYPNCQVALKWWCNKNGDGSSYNICRNKWLKEFMVSNPPQFKISNMCCQYAKKKPSDRLIKERKIDLSIIGVRKSEGGIRSTNYKTCFDRDANKEIAHFRPIFWYKNFDKLEYNEHYKIMNSLCYSKYGLSRTGCAGCPFGKDFEQELVAIEKYEPKLFKAVNNIFGQSYEYTRAYRDFCNKRI